MTEGTYPPTKQLEGGYTVLELPTREAALEWAAKIAVPVRAGGARVPLQSRELTGSTVSR